MRTFKLFLCMMVVAASAAACGSQADPAAPAASGATPVQTETAAASESGAASDKAQGGEEWLTVQHSLGETKIPAQPERIAVTHQILIDWLHPLGYKVSVAPMARPNQEFEPYTPEEQKRDMTLIGPPGEPNLEALLSEEPDVIFVNWGHDKAYEQLSKIAPSVFVEFQDDWRELLRTYGRMLNKEELAEAWLNAYQQKAEAAKARLSEAVAGETVVFIRFLPKELRIYANHPTSSVGGVLYHDLGLKPVSEPAGEMYEAISLEGLAQLNPDHIFMQIGFVPATDDEAARRYNEITEGPVWKGINAVAKNQVYLVESAFFSNSPLGKQYMIDVVLENLLGE